MESVWKVKVDKSPGIWKDVTERYCQCRRCGWSWFRRTRFGVLVEPKVCPRCWSRKWKEGT